MHRRLLLAAAIGASLLAGCSVPGGTVDTRFSAIEAEVVKVDDYPVAVKVLKVSDSIYDVEAAEGRFIAFTGVNEPLLQQDRFRRASSAVLPRHLPRGATFTTKSEFAPVGRAVMFLRYEVRAPQGR